MSDMAPPSASVSAAERPTVSVLRVPESERRQGQRHGQRRLEQHHLAVASVDHVSVHVPREPVDDAEAACGGSLEPDVEEGDEGKGSRDDRQHPVETAAHRPRSRRQGDHEDRRAAQGEKEQSEVEEPTGREEGLDRVRVSGQGVQRDRPGRDPSLLHVEDERAGDRVRVRRDGPPRHGVGPGLELSLDPDRHLPAVGRAHLFGVDPVPLTVEHADAPEGHLDGLVEAQRDALRRLLHHDVVPGLGAQQHGVRERARCENDGERTGHRERCDETTQFDCVLVTDLPLLLRRLRIATHAIPQRSPLQGTGRSALASGADERGRRGDPVAGGNCEARVRSQPEAWRYAELARQHDGSDEQGARHEQGD